MMLEFAAVEDQAVIEPAFADEQRHRRWAEWQLFDAWKPAALTAALGVAHGQGLTGVADDELGSGLNAQACATRAR